MSLTPDLVLASASPRRRELLERVGLRLLVRPADVDETPRPGERPGDYVRRISAAKCDAMVVALSNEPDPVPSLPVVAADTIVIVDDDIVGKPRDDADARAMLSRLAGRRHDVTTAYRVRHRAATLDRAVTTTVSFRSVQATELDAYIASGEWRGKAGGYAVQGIAAAFVTEVRGSITTVIGLPLPELLADLQALEALPRYPPPGFGASSRE
jgi:septum formation protein